MKLAKITVEMIAGLSAKQTFQEAIRLSQLLNVMVTYKFNDLMVCVSGDYLIYALEEDGQPSTWYEALCDYDTN